MPFIPLRSDIAAAFAAFDALPAHIAVLDHTAHVVHVNAAWRTFAAANAMQNPQVGVGTNYLDVCDGASGDCAEEASTVARALRETLSGERSTFLLDYACHSPTQARWFRISITPYRVSGMNGAVVMHVNITGQEDDAVSLRNAEQEARESERRLSFALEATHIGDWSLDLRTNEAHRSRRHDECFGYREMLPDWSYETFLAHVYADDRETVNTCFQAAMAGTGDCNAEFRTVWPDGSLHWLWTRGSVYLDDLGAPIRMAGVIMDITARKEAEAVSQRLASIVSSSDDAIIGKDLQSIITSWNRGAQKVFGYSERDMIGNSIMRLIPDERQDEERLILERIRDGHSIEHFETVRRRKDGTLIEVSITVSPIRDGRGRIIGVSKVARDITERKKLEQRFLRAQRMESIGTLAGGIAHDLNNVLHPIMLSLEILRDAYAESEQRDLLDSIERSARHGKEMVQQVLSFARGVEGQRLPVDIGALVADVATIAADTFLKNIDVSTHVTDDLWLVVGDTTQLHQVLLNLAVNARDAMPRGGSLTVSAENVFLDEQYTGLNAEGEAGPHVRITVVDTGIGMSESTAAQIFDPFFTTKEVGRGTGLGLSTSQAIVKSHGGFIRLYTELSRGSTFSVYLPARTTSAASAAKTPVSLPRGQGETILVVDDEPSVRHVTQQTLEAFGYKVALASDGSEALAIFARRSNEIDVVITDMTMPIMDGAATIRVLRKMDPQLKIIAASGLDVRDQAAGLAVNDVLAKPYAAETLLNLLKKVLTDSRKG